MNNTEKEIDLSKFFIIENDMFRCKLCNRLFLTENDAKAHLIYHERIRKGEIIVDRNWIFKYWQKNAHSHHKKVLLI